MHRNKMKGPRRLVVKISEVGERCQARGRCQYQPPGRSCPPPARALQQQHLHSGLLPPSFLPVTDGHTWVRGPGSQRRVRAGAEP